MNSCTPNDSVIFWVDDDEEDFEVYRECFHEVGFSGSIVSHYDADLAAQELKEFVSMRMLPKVVIIGNSIRSVSSEEAVTKLSDIVFDYPVPLVQFIPNTFLYTAVSDRACLAVTKPSRFSEIQSFCKEIIRGID